MIEMSDPSDAGQLTKGFYGLEQKRWRWTAREFALVLEPPPGADERGANLEVALFIPDSQIQQLGPMTLSADVDGQALPPATFTKGGGDTYSCEVPAAALRSNLVTVSFSFDKALPPGDVDGRELAAVVTRVGLVAE